MSDINKDLGKNSPVYTETGQGVDDIVGKCKQIINLSTNATIYKGFTDKEMSDLMESEGYIRQCCYRKDNLGDISI